MFNIGKRKISSKHKPLIICELGINHNGSLSLAKKMVDIAYKNGAEVIKNQSHILDEEMIGEAKKIKPLNAKTSIYNVIKKNLMKFEDEIKLMKYVKNKGMIYLSTPFSSKAADQLYKLGVSAFKIGSGECNNIPFLKKILRFKKPIILSTGMNDLDSIKRSVRVIEKAKVKYALLHCKSEYPANYKNLRLDFLGTLRKHFPKAEIGYSDHSIGVLPSISAMAKGANIIEKHFTDNKKRQGPDIICSMDPKELKLLKKAADVIHYSNGADKKISKKEKSTAKFAFASVVSLTNIEKGELFSKKNIWVKRPGTGYFPAHKYYKLIGKKAKRFIKSDNFISKRDV